MSVQVAVFNKRSCPVGNVQHDWTLTKEGRKYCVQGQNERGVFDSKKEAVQSLANKVKQMTFVFDFQTQGSLEKNLHDLYVWNR
ncbi:MAG: hypothetical protein KDK65_05680, partial [Chlamydiia bacterium]|nr:hypothetical protein [Chlamydiia bacterium]